MATSNLKKKPASATFGGRPPVKPKTGGTVGNGGGGSSGGGGYGFGFGGAPKATGGGGGGLFSNTNEHQSANTLENAYAQGFQGARHQLGQGYKGFQKDYSSALNKFRQGAGTATGYIDTGLGQSTGAITTGQNAALGNVTSARDAALGYYQPYANATAGAAPLYANALGLNGASGNAAATSAFQAGPGYDWQLGQGLQALDRTAASRGMLASGNTTQDTMTYAQGLANQEYQNWLTRLAAEQGFGADIAGNMGTIQTNAGGQLADINTGAATNLANLYAGAGTAKGNIATNLGTQQAAIKTGLGDMAYQYGTDIANLGYASRLGASGVQADFLKNKDQTGANIFGLATGGVSLGAKLLGAGA